ncbi:carboxylesterase/lipase family protein [Fodinibius salsisoli]|uniref:Carboxylic ester hydrolase n=1 Tax=Fodinibius salsisoli TaxID=2820877 RepID=A0ABT3PQD5_9BACT|nr:carboxylesterase family protein [Fodinibius salsisoli]MCW9708045.1 carboxylesterase family protein [Fodinibius salsisoli]
MEQFFYSVLSILFLFYGVADAQPDTLRIDTGLVTGVSESGSTVHAYKGIPYAAPPVGDLRWQPPQPPTTWEGVYHATDFASTCMQKHPPKGSFYQVEFFQEPEPMSEDCLYLNVWTGAESAENLRPVMMWIHGGAFSQGSGSMPTFNGNAFAKSGVVLVTLNYRLGIFGLLAHPQLTAESEHNSSGNYGLLDQVAALQWIQQNIDAFGGNPNNVTVFGQSSGAGSINKLMASPLTKGLFDRAILQSGSAYTFGKTQALEQAEQNGETVTKLLGTSSIEGLRSWPASKLLDKTSQFSFRPSIDGWFLPDEVYSIFEEGRQHDIPILAGSNADEGTTLRGPKLDAKIFTNIIHQTYGEDAKNFLALYPHQTDQQARNSFNKGWRDEMAWGAHTLARIHTKQHSQKAWLYYFSNVPPGRNSQRYGAFHSAEIAYVFNTLTAVDRPWQKQDHQLADLMRSYWVNFASEGNPNSKQLPKWPPYDARERKVLELGNTIEPQIILQGDVLEFYNKQYVRPKEE